MDYPTTGAKSLTFLIDIYSEQEIWAQERERERASERFASLRSGFYKMAFYIWWVRKSQNVAFWFYNINQAVEAPYLHQNLRPSVLCWWTNFHIEIGHRMHNMEPNAVGIRAPSVHWTLTTWRRLLKAHKLPSSRIYQTLSLLKSDWHMSFSLHHQAKANCQEVGWYRVEPTVDGSNPEHEWFDEPL
jgi:hypothetical protein